MITSILVGLASGAAIKLGVLATASALGVPAATAAGGLKLFTWGRRAKTVAKILTPKPAPPIVGVVAKEPEGFRPTWMQQR